MLSQDNASVAPVVVLELGLAAGSSIQSRMRRVVRSFSAHGGFKYSERPTLDV